MSKTEAFKKLAIATRMIELTPDQLQEELVVYFRGGDTDAKRDEAQHARIKRLEQEVADGD